MSIKIKCKLKQSEIYLIYIFLELISFSKVITIYFNIQILFKAIINNIIKFKLKTEVVY